MKRASVHITVGRLLSMAPGWVFIAAAVGKGVNPEATLEAIRYFSHDIIGFSVDLSGGLF